MAIRIPFVADIADFLRGTQNLEEGLKDVIDTLDDVSTAGSDVDTKVGADLTAVGQEADQAAEKIERSFKDAFGAVERQGRTSTGKVKRDLDETGRHGSRTMNEFSSEAKQNVAESLSSFQGDASSAVDAVQSTFGGLVSALGPAGVIGAAVAAAGIGLARGLFASAQAEAEKLRERVSDLFEEMAANKGVIGDAFKADQIRELIGDAEKLKEAFGTDEIDKINENFERLNLGAEGQRVLFAGLVGDAKDMAAAQALVNEQQAIWLAQLNDPKASGFDRAQARARLDFLAQLESQYRTQTSVIEAAAAQQDLYASSARETTDATKRQTGATDDATTATRGLSDALDDVPGSTTAKVRVDVDASALRDFDRKIRRLLDGTTYYVQVAPRVGKNVPG